MWIRLAVGGVMLLAPVVAGWAQTTRPRAPLPEAPIVKPAKPTTAPASSTRGPNGETLVSLHYTNASPENIFADLGQQAGITFGRGNYPITSTLYAGNQPPVVTILKDTLDPDFGRRALTIHLDKQPFWVAVQELCGRTGADPYVNRATGAVALYRATTTPFHKLPSSVSGPLLVVAESVACNRALDLNNATRPNRRIIVSFTVFADPAMKFAMQAGNLADLKAVDDEGRELLPFATERPRAVFATRGIPCWDAHAVLAYPEKLPGAKIASLKGTLIAQTSEGTETAEFADLRAHLNEAKNLGDVQVSVVDVKTKDSSSDAHTRIKDLTVSLGVTWKPPASYDLVLDALRQTRIVDAQGKTIKQAFTGGGKALPGGHEFLVMFNRVTVKDTDPAYDQPLPEPARLIVEMPGRMQEVAFPVEFKNLPLPR